jgi:hypothetical protein
MDMATVGSLLTSLKTATDIAKFIRESDLSLERSELKLKLAELMAALADAKIDAANVQQQIFDRDEQIKNLEAAAKVKADLRWQQPCYYLKNSEGSEEPYCQNCWDSASKLPRLHADGKGLFQCRVCNQVYKTDERERSDKAAMDARFHNRGPNSWMAS